MVRDKEAEPWTLVSWERLEAMSELASTSPPGTFIEVGIYKGGTASLLYEIAAKQKRAIYLYDTFKGLPYSDPIDEHPVGDFNQCMSKKDAMIRFPRAAVIEGIFPNVKIPDEIAFCHLDVDQYRCYREGLDAVLPRMVKGGMVLCDDYAHLKGCRKAVDETETTGRKLLMKDGRMLFIL